MAEEFLNHYAILQVAPKATLKQITAAYRRQSELWHPDRCKDPRAAEMQQKINDAYEVLKDADKREQYDQFVAARQARRQVGHVVEPPPVPPQYRDLPPYQPSLSRKRSLVQIAAYTIGILGIGIILASAVVTAVKRPKSPAALAQEIAAREQELRNAQALRDLEQREARAKAEAELAAIKQKQDSDLATIALKGIQAEGEKVFVLLKALGEEIDGWESQIRPLLTNDRGKLLSADEADVRTFQACWKEERPTKSDLTTIRERVTTLLRVVNAELAKSQPSMVPEASLTERLKAEAMEVEKLTEKARAPRQQIERLLVVAERATRVSTTPLQQAIEDLNARDVEARNAIIGKVEAENQKKIVEAEVARKKLEGESNLNAVNARAELERLAAERALARERALKNAQSPETRALLAFFLTPGYVQPGPTMTAEKRPISYGKLAAQGFLDPSLEGLSRLYQLVNEKDPDRPYLKERHTIYRNQTDAKKQYIVRMQKALIELGPALVELKLLDP